MEQGPAAGIWDRGHHYEAYVGRWSRKVAAGFLAWLRVPAGRRWVDVGCGTGALCEAILDRCSPASVIGVEPSEDFLRVAEEGLGGRAMLRRGIATDIPLEGSAVDVVVSGLVLNFVPDQRAALVEMGRVAGGGGTVAAYVWDYAGRMEFMRIFWDTARELNPEAEREDEGVRFPGCHPSALAELFVGAGLREIAVTELDIPTRFASFEDFWLPFLGGQGPAPGYVVSLDETARARLRDRLRERLPTAADGSVSLTARAWAIRGTVDK
jgi:SAM-dependent methyltransferase